MSDKSFHLTLSPDERCAECGDGYATPNTLCLSCTTRAINPKAKMKSVAGKAVQRRWASTLRRPSDG